MHAFIHYASALIVFCLLCQKLQAQAAAPEFSWVLTTGSQIGDIAVDSSDNVYAAIRSGDNAVRSINLAGRTLSEFTGVAKISPRGECLWLVPSDFHPGAWVMIAVDPTGVSFVASEGRIKKYFPDGGVAGSFAIDDSMIYAIKLNRNGDLFLLSTPDDYTARVSSYTSAFGFNWHFALRADSRAVWSGISFDSQGNPLVVGSFGRNMEVLGTQRQSLGAADIMVARFGANTGALENFQTFGGPDYDAGVGISVAGGRSWIGGFSGESGIPSLGIFDRGAFAAQFTDSGIVSVTNASINELSYLAADASENIYAAETALTRNPDGTVQRDARVVCFSSTGQPRWSRTMGGLGLDQAFRVVANGPHAIFVLGYFQDTATFGSIQRTASRWSDSFLAKLAPVPASIPVTVTTIAGSGEQGHLDSLTALTAKLSSPDGGGVTRDGIIYFGDAGNHVIRYLLPNGEVGTLAGTPNVSGYREDFGLNSLFNVPLGLHVTANGDLLVGDYANHRVRKIAGRGYARSTLLAGGGNDPGLQPIPGAYVRLNGPNDLVQAPTGEIYFTEFLNHTIRKIALDRKVHLIAGSPGQPGYQNGLGPNARFNGPAGIAIRGADLYVTDWNNHRIRKVTLSGEVTTHAGSGAPGLQSGYGTAAQFSAPNGIVADPAGNFYITEFSNHTIRRIAPDGWVSTLAGNGTPAHADGDRETARFNAPGGISIHPDTSLIIADTGNHRIRRLVLNNTTTPITPTETLVTAELKPTLKIHGAPGERYRIESTDTLTPNNWQPLETITLTTSPQTWTDPRPPLQSRLYRSIRE